MVRAAAVAKGGRPPEDDWFGISARSNASAWFATGKWLSCENQHELCVDAHKYHRLLVIPQQPFDGGATLERIQCSA